MTAAVDQNPGFLRDPFNKEAITMNRQTPDQGWQQLQEIIEGFFDHVLRKEKENAILSASCTAKIEQSVVPSAYRQRREKERDRAENWAASP